MLGVAAGGLIVLTNLQTLADRANASGITEGLLASMVFTLWVLWTAWAVKLDQAYHPGRPAAHGEAVGARASPLAVVADLGDARSLPPRRRRRRAPAAEQHVVVGPPESRSGRPGP